MPETIERPRIFSHITRTRFLHVEDSLEIGKVRFFIGAYQRGNGADATAYHFLDADDARVLFADLSWGKAVDFVDFKGSANGGQPVSRVMKVKGPKDGKYWLQVDNGPGEIIGQGAVKPAGQPDASVSIALTTWEARKLALAISEYLTAYRVAALIHPSPSSPPPSPSHHGDDDPVKAAVERYTTDDPTRELADHIGQELHGDELAEEEANDNTPTAFYQLAPLAIKAGMLDLVNALVQAPGPWSEKAAQLKEALAA